MSEERRILDWSFCKLDPVHGDWFIMSVYPPDGNQCQHWTCYGRRCSRRGRRSALNGLYLCTQHKSKGDYYMSPIATCKHCKRVLPGDNLRTRIVVADDGFITSEKIKVQVWSSRHDDVCSVCASQDFSWCEVCGKGTTYKTREIGAALGCCSIDHSNINKLCNSKNQWVLDESGKRVVRAKKPSEEILLSYLKNGIRRHKKKLKEAGVDWSEHKHHPIYEDGIVTRINKPSFSYVDRMAVDRRKYAPSLIKRQVRAKFAGLF